MLLVLFTIPLRASVHNLELVHKRRENKEEREEGMMKKLFGNVAEFVQQKEPLGIEQIVE